MVADQRAAPASIELGEYRIEIVRVGMYMGWTEVDVIRFVEGVTGVLWEDCRAGELDRVVAAFGELAARMRDRLAHEMN